MQYNVVCLPWLCYWNANNLLYIFRVSFAFFSPVFFCWLFFVFVVLCPSNKILNANKTPHIKMSVHFLFFRFCWITPKPLGNPCLTVDIKCPVILLLLLLLFRFYYPLFKQWSNMISFFFFFFFFFGFVFQYLLHLSKYLSIYVPSWKLH